jgi:glycosyltransferase involved in cell wall biosynthesis
VLFLGYSFGLPVIAAEVGSLKEEIIEGGTGCGYEDGLLTAAGRLID